MLRIRFYLTRSQLSWGVRWPHATRYCWMASMKRLVAPLLLRYFSLLASVACASHGLAAQTPTSKPTTGCGFSGGPKSSLAWESGLAQGQGPATPVPRDAIVGRVISVRNGEPVVDAVIRLDPGNHFARADSTGRFTFPPLPQGRYRVNVMSWTSGSAADSVTLGFDGLRIVAALSRYAGDLICIVPTRQPSNER